MISKKPSSYFTTESSSSSRSSSRQPSSHAGWDADDEDAMSGEDQTQSNRPPSLAIPQGPYCPRRPNLKEILANTSPAPWTLAAFMAYLSHNHCLETLEFTMDAGRYKKHYAKMLSKAGADGVPSAKDCEYVQLLWIRLIDAYIRPNGSREVNLPSSVRDPILEASSKPLPPSPETLDIAVEKTFELMEDSVLVPFLNSCYPQTPNPPASASWSEPADRAIPVSAHPAHPLEDRHSMFHRRTKNIRSSPPPNNKLSPLTNTVSSSSGTAASDVNLSAAGSASAYGMTDDSGSTGSPTIESPLTPPTSPPMSDLASISSQSPRHSRDSGMWKKLGRLSGMKASKKKSHSNGGPLNEEGH